MPPKRSNNADNGDRIKFMAYSGPNSGKTHLLGTAGDDERTAPMAMVDFEGGTKTLDGMPGFFKMPDLTSDIPSGTTVASFRCHSWEDFNSVFERVAINDDGLKACALDSISEVHNYACEHLVEVNAERRKEEMQDVIQQDDYGKALLQLRRLVREFRDLPLHFFCTAHSKDVTHPKRGMITVPNLYGKGAFEIPGLLETVGYVAVLQADSEVAKEFKITEGEEYRSLLLRNEPKLDLKARTAWGVTAPEYIDLPTVTKLLDALGYKH